MGGFDERQQLRVDGSDTNSVRGQLRALVFVGLAHPIGTASSATVWFDEHTALGVGPTFDTGHWQVLLREDVTVAWAGTRWLTLRAGLGAGFTLDATGPRRSFADVGVPVSATLFQVVELVYRPMLTIPVSGETTTVLGGTSTLAASLAIVPFDVQLRFRIPPLGF